MKFVVGLGNPGPKYETTRHNVGFLAIDRLMDRWGAGSPKLQAQAEVYSVSSPQKLLLIKPQTFMNRSGVAVAELARFYKVAPADIVVLLDDLDLAPLAVRFKLGGGSAGHNGIKSIDQSLGSPDYYRARIGIGHPRMYLDRKNQNVADYVLENFSDEELSELDRCLDDVAQGVEWILQGNFLQAQNRFHRRGLVVETKE
jgi:PTH1 family peptidyl-tRNA hydrolase